MGGQKLVRFFLGGSTQNVFVTAVHTIKNAPNSLFLRWMGGAACDPAPDAAAPDAAAPDAAAPDAASQTPLDTVIDIFVDDSDAVRFGQLLQILRGHSVVFATDEEAQSFGEYAAFYGVSCKQVWGGSRKVFQLCKDHDGYRYRGKAGNGDSENHGIPVLAVHHFKREELFSFVFGAGSCGCGNGLATQPRGAAGTSAADGADYALGRRSPGGAPAGRFSPPKPPSSPKKLAAALGVAFGSSSAPAAVSRGRAGMHETRFAADSEDELSFVQNRRAAVNDDPSPPSPPTGVLDATEVLMPGAFDTATLCGEEDF